MRRHCAAALVTLALAGNGECAAAQDSYPNRPIHIVIPFPAGGPADIAARIIGQKMSEEWGQPVVVDNRPGGNTIIGAEFVAKAAPDGYTLMMAIDSTLVMNQFLYKSLPYDPLKDFAPITTTVKSMSLLAVQADGAEDRERADRARQGCARQAQFRRRHDHRAAHGRAVQQGRRH